MTMRDLIPWGRSSSQKPSVFRDAEQAPFVALHREMNRLFDDVFRGFDSRLPTFGAFSSIGSWPNVEIAETDREVRVSAELPGMEEKDVEVLLQDGMLTLRGEKRAESNGDGDGRHFSERFYGLFERRIPLDADIDEKKVGAVFRSGVLTITLPKSAEAQSKAKRIPIKS